VIFSNVFLPILLNIGLYTYIVRYKSGIKIPGFLQNISKNSKHFRKKKTKQKNLEKLLNQFPFSKKNIYVFMQTAKS